MRDVMRRQDLGVHRGSFSATLAPHAFMLVRLSPRRGKLAAWDTWTPPEVRDHSDNKAMRPVRLLICACLLLSWQCDSETEEVDEYHVEWSPGVVVFTTLFAVLTVLTLNAAVVIVVTVWRQRATLRQPRGTNMAYSRVPSTDS